MNSFETVGEAQLLAMEGQRQIAALIARALGRVLNRLNRTLERCHPEGRLFPW